VVTSGQGFKDRSVQIVVEGESGAIETFKGVALIRDLDGSAAAAEQNDKQYK